MVSSGCSPVAEYWQLNTGVLGSISGNCRSFHFLNFRVITPKSLCFYCEAGVLNNTVFCGSTAKAAMDLHDLIMFIRNGWPFIYYPARACAKGLSNRFLLVCQSVCLVKNFEISTFTIAVCGDDMAI